MSPERNRRVVFVVDDENLIALTLELILVSNGFDARRFVDPADALQAAHLGAPDLLLTEVVMPSMTGIQLAILTKQICPNCEVLLASGEIEASQLLSEAESRGQHFEILAKPIHPRELLEKIDELFDSHVV